MLTIFMEHRLLSGAFLLLLLLSIICQIVIGVIYRRIIKETEHMSSTENKLLKQCKLKFIHCFQMNEGVSNIPVFVDKFIGKVSFMGISLTGMQHLSGQFMLLSVVTAGIGAFLEIIEGETVGKVLPYYIVSFLGLYVYFAITGMVDIQGKKEKLKTNLVDYLENHMANKLRQSAVDWQELTGEPLVQAAEPKDKGKAKLLREEIGLLAERNQKKEQTQASKEEATKNTKIQTALSHQEEQELEELLREFLV